MIKKTVLTIIVFTVFLACKNDDKKTETPVLVEIEHETIETTKADSILAETIAAHGGKLYNSANYSFIFRGNTYHFKNDETNYNYIKVSKKGDLVIKDVLKNDDFIREINGNVIQLSTKETASGKAVINSVIYFATLPHKLNDKAINSKYIEKIVIKNKTYSVVEITFNKEGGGEDHEDEFYYWINNKTKKIDYLAYNYKVNKGGVRFRSAFNKRTIDGITFQDYINYKAEIGTLLKDLPKLYEANKLKELSKIKTENIINLNKN